MDASGKLNQMAYERQHEKHETAKPVQFFEDQNWRDEMILSLGISNMDATPQETTDKVWQKFDSLEEVHQHILTPMFDPNHVQEKKIRYFGGHTITVER